MIIVGLKGGTGNQLFQYALGRHLALKNNTELKLDITSLIRANEIGNIYRPYTLEAFNVAGTLATPEEIRRLKYPFGIFSKARRYAVFRLYSDKNTLFYPKVLTWTGNRYLDGYWQSPLYFDAIRDTLLKDLTLKEPFSPAAQSYADAMTQATTVSLHVRRGDYVKNPRVLKEFGICSVEYYKRAMAEIEQNVPSPTYFVFSDDIDWVKQNLPVGKNTVFVKDPTITDTEELMLMSLATHNIIANSSFSWWGAWLNQNPNKMVVAPTPWFDLQPTDPHLIPHTWIQLQK